MISPVSVINSLVSDKKSETLLPLFSTKERFFGICFEKFFCLISLARSIRVEYACLRLMMEMFLNPGLCQAFPDSR